MEQRIQKIIASTGKCSRRKAEKLIEEGKVKLNGEIAKLGDKAEETDIILINDTPITIQEKKHYYILNKPKTYLVTKDDPEKRKTIYDLESLQQLKKKLKFNLNYVGRLDGLSEGLLLLTNDGELTNKLTHPKNHVEKKYKIRTDPKIKKTDIAQIEHGMRIDGINFDGEITNRRDNTFDITIHEGRNRIIRRVLQDFLGYRIFMLKRTKIGDLGLGDLGEGQIQEISKPEFK